MKTEQQVLSFAPSSSKPGAWLKMKVIDDKGENRDAYLKPENLIALVKQPGVYEFEKEKVGKFWEITGVRFVRPLGDAAPASNGNGTKTSSVATPRSSGAADVNVVIQNRAITAQVCVKAAAELFGKALEAGAFKLDGGVVDTDLLTTCAAAMSRKFMDEAKAFVRGDVETSAPKQEGTSKSYVDDAGRVHESVEGA